MSWGWLGGLVSPLKKALQAARTILWAVTSWLSEVTRVRSWNSPALLRSLMAGPQLEV